MQLLLSCSRFEKKYFGGSKYYYFVLPYHLHDIYTMRQFVLLLFFYRYGLNMQVILTGGPCGGKTSILDVLSKEFKQQVE